jgi:tetratricopeptide (TPR) repeat protein
MRHAALLPLLLCACSSVSSEQRDQLALHQRNAKFYLEGNKLDQALQQIERGLEIEPDDYSLNAMRGAVLLRSSGSSLGTDHRLLDEATDQLAKVYDFRSIGRHEPYLLFDYARALQKQGRRHLGEAVRLRDQATRAPGSGTVAAEASTAPAPTADELRERADAEQEIATSQLTQARELLESLVERGEILLQCHLHLVLIAQDLRDDELFRRHEATYLEQIKLDQTRVRREIERTSTPSWEQEQLAALRTMRDQELEMRSLFALFHWQRKEHEAALEHLNRVLEIDPARSTDYYNRGRVLLDLERRDDAKADFRKFLATTDLPSSSEKKTFAAQALAQ